MNMPYLTISLTLAALLQACAAFPGATDASHSVSTVPVKNTDAKKLDVPKSITSKTISNLDKTKNVEKLIKIDLEAQIIRELISAGCLIEKFEMNRRKQNMRISCAKQIKTNDFDS